MRRAAYLMMALICLISVMNGRASYAAPNDRFADSAFRERWVRADGPIAGGTATRSWTWGDGPGPRQIERYAESPNGTRLVQYFDKARMEITQPSADRAGEWYATNGLLVVEMIGGRVQLGDTTFADRTPAAVPVAGDPQGGGPTYASLRTVATIDGSHRAADRTGAHVNQTLDADGNVGAAQDDQSPETELVRYEAITGHNIPRAFDAFQRSVSAFTNGLGTFGYPISEAYWTNVLVGGESKRVLLQAFERRVLTYTPDNPAPWQVEMGNVGQHYYRWRYNAPMFMPRSDDSHARVIDAGFVSISTEGYAQALVNTTPDDPIYPYQRIDRSRLGSYNPQKYHLLRLENQHLALTLMPELGGRIYQAWSKSTGHNIFYENPVIKASPLGQRGWWLAAGGMEWAAPTEEHGYLEYVPWNVRTEQTATAARVIVSTTEAHTGISLEITIELENDAAFFTVRGTYRNTTAVPQPFQFWMNAMLAPGAGNRLNDSLHFVVPTSQMIVHATQDAALPAPRQSISWPNYAGRDLSRYATWNGYIGLFAADDLTGRWAGVYDPQVDEGIAIADVDAALPGIKTFAFGRSFDRSLYTTDGSDYAELWHGAQPTFWDYPTLDPGESRSFRAIWQPTFGLGDFAAATRAGSVGLSRSPDNALIVAIQPSRTSASGPVRISINGSVRWNGTLSLNPEQPLRVELPGDIAAGSAVHVEWAEQAVNIVAP